MLFSDSFKITLRGDEDWFDPLLSSDIKLFIDPFLIFEDDTGPFKGAHAEIVSFFQYAFNLVAKAAGNRSSTHWKQAISILKTPEVEEVCLGYTARGTDGGGSGAGKAGLLADAFEKAIAFGLAAPEHFETVQLFRKKIGPDTISDAVANILRMRLAEYTKEICASLAIPMETAPHLRARFDAVSGRWKSGTISAPVNKYNGKQILLCPKRFLRPLPSINPDEYWGYCYDTSGDELRREFGHEIGRSVDKAVIIENALKHFNTVEDFIQFVEKAGGEAYDIDSDPKGLVKWYHETKAYVEERKPRVKIASPGDLQKFIDYLIDEFRNYVANNKGWKLLYGDDGKPRSEEICQLAFLGLVKHICYFNDIDITREANIGRGPVDFKFSRGFSARALIEMKLVKNSKFWSGLKKQLPKYLEAENITYGTFLIVAFASDEPKKVKSARAAARTVAKALGYTMSVSSVMVEYRPPSASDL